MDGEKILILLKFSDGDRPLGQVKEGEGIPLLIPKSLLYDESPEIKLKVFR